MYQIAPSRVASGSCGREPGVGTCQSLIAASTGPGMTTAAGRGPTLRSVIRYIHAAGPMARLSLEQVQNREPVEVETPRVTLASLDLKEGDLVNLRLRQAHSFDDDYAI